ncbi:MAG TPA: LamG domain-containing protein [Anaerolineae bacterium]|nr:LamG domain-containing protein [Anaerolineae bacterium]
MFCPSPIQRRLWLGLSTTLFATFFLLNLSFTSTTQANSSPPTHLTTDCVCAQSLAFDGVDDYVLVTNNPTANFGTSNFTFEAWIKGDEAAQVTHPQIMSTRGGDGTGFLFGFHAIWGGSANKIPYVQLGNVNYIAYANPPNLLDNQWHHFAAVRNGTQLYYYADGEQVANITLAGNHSLTTSADLFIGHDVFLSSTNTPFEGLIDELRIWNTARSQTEIQQMMNTTLTGSETNLVAYWQLQNDGSQTIIDRTTNGYHGTLGSTTTTDNNDPSWQAGYALGRTTTLQFDGLNDRVIISNTVANSIGTGDFTFETWVKGDESLQVAHPQIMSNRGGSGSGFLFGFHNNWGGSANKIPFVQLQGVNHIGYANPPNLLDNQWHHFAVTRQGTTLTYYADGQQINVMNLSSIPDISNSNDLWLGQDAASSGTTPFEGYLDELRIWNVARSASEIEDGMHRRLTGSESGLIAYWRMDEGAGQPLTDATSNNYHGQLGTIETTDDNDPLWACCALTSAVPANASINNDTNIFLDWSTTISNTALYQVWYSNTPYFATTDVNTTLIGFSNNGLYTHIDPLSNSAVNHFYAITLDNLCQEPTINHYVGAFTYSLTVGQ